MLFLQFGINISSDHEQIRKSVVIQIDMPAPQLTYLFSTEAGRDRDIVEFALTGVVEESGSVAESGS